MSKDHVLYDDGEVLVKFSPGVVTLVVCEKECSRTFFVETMSLHEIADALKKAAEMLELSRKGDDGE